MKKNISIWWIRRDIRVHDNACLRKALSEGKRLLPVFIFDRTILDHLPAEDARVTFIHRELSALKVELESLGSTLWSHYGTPQSAFEQLLSEFDIDTVFMNRDYEPYALERDQGIMKLLQTRGVSMIGAKDSVVFEKSEVVKDDGSPYTVFTPYSKKWLATWTKNPQLPHDYSTQDLFEPMSPYSMISLSDMGFRESTLTYPPKDVKTELLRKYAHSRDIPSEKGTSRISIHLRFGTVSIRQMVKLAMDQGADVWLNELIWRDFYQMILHHFPYSAERSFKPAYDRIPWINDEADFQKWCKGETGFPLVDAGMRELNATGFMHNRVRMLTASFLTKHLLIDWRWGERYFAEKLLDFDLASNIGGWQWAAGSGCDAAPYFRVFSPASQQDKFDPNYLYVRKWVPEYGTASYPPPMVDHSKARQRAIDVYKRALTTV